MRTIKNDTQDPQAFVIGCALFLKTYFEGPDWSEKLIWPEFQKPKAFNLMNEVIVSVLGEMNQANVELPSALETFIFSIPIKLAFVDLNRFRPTLRGGPWSPN